MSRRRFTIAAFAVLGLSVVLLPWYALDDYVPNGWDATWWARVALAAALAGLALASAGRAPRAQLALAAIALAAVVFRLADPPDFGFGFDGLDVPTARRAGPWVAVGAALLALLALAPELRRERPLPAPDSPRSGTGPAASAS
jgi:hypothetical protein